MRELEAVYCTLNQDKESITELDALLWARYRKNEFNLENMRYLNRSSKKYNSRIYELYALF